MLLVVHWHARRQMTATTSTTIMIKGLYAALALLIVLPFPQIHVNNAMWEEGIVMVSNNKLINCINDLSTALNCSHFICALFFTSKKLI